MDFSLTEEQTMLRDSADKLVRARFDVERHRSLSKTPLGYDSAAWAQFAELGWLGIPFPERDDGFGGGAVELMVISEALGKGLVREPYLATVVTCGGFLSRAGDEQQRARFIPGIIQGATQWAFAFAEQHSGYDLASIATRADAQPDGYQLSGSKIAVLNGHMADFLIVSARTAGAGGDRDGISLFIVDTGAAGVVVDSFGTVDGGRAATISLDGVTVPAGCLLGELNRAYPLMEAVIDGAIVAIGGEALGAMQVLLDTTVEYCKTRKQFGQAIGNFQALQHRMADMYLQVEETRSLLYYCAIQQDAGAADAPAACAALKVKLAEAGKFVSQQAVQLHGGIGMTDELVVGHHFKRLLLLAVLYGDENYYLHRYTALGGFSN